jgi:hypothetical protein
MILIASTGQYSMQIPQPLHFFEAKNVFAKKKRPMNKYKTLMGLTARSNGKNARKYHGMKRWPLRISELKRSALLWQTAGSKGVISANQIKQHKREVNEPRNLPYFRSAFIVFAAGRPACDIIQKV